MIALLQRVSSASMQADTGDVVAIGAGMVALIGIEKSDSSALVTKLAGRLLGYRMFPDEQGRMNLNVQQAGGSVLLVPNFTLAADTRRGLRPGFESAAPPDRAQPLFDQLLDACRSGYDAVESGVFGADMQIQLINTGPVTFWLQVQEAAQQGSF